jgi:hypothetical protein
VGNINRLDSHGNSSKNRKPIDLHSKTKPVKSLF